MSLLLGLLLALPAQVPAPARPGDEGDLQNRSFLPLLPPAAEGRLREAEAALARGLVGEARHALRQLRERTGADLAEAAADVVLADERLGLGLEEYLRARLFGLEEASEDALRAWLRQGDLALERGDFLAASSWFRRLAATGRSTEIRLPSAELQRRQEFAAKRVLRATEPPPRLVGLQTSWAAPLEQESGPAPFFTVPVWTPEGLLLQTAKHLYVFREDGLRLLALDLDSFLLERDLLLRTGREKCKGPSLPLHRPAAEGLILVVHGDPEPPHFANRLAALRLVAEDGRCRAEIVWQRGWGLEKRNELEGLTFSPEPLVAGGRVFVGAQRVREEISSFLLCFEAGTGALLWKRFLAKGARPGGEPERFSDAERMDQPGTTIVLLEGSVLYGTNLGILAAVDPVDGALLWCFRYARVGSAQGGWRWSTIQRQDEAIVFAAADSDWLYLLRPGPAAGEPLGTPALLASAPRPRGGAVQYVGAANEADIVLEGSPVKPRLLGTRRVSGATFFSCTLGGEENSLWAQLVQGDAFLLTSRRLFRLDPGKELRLEEEIALGDQASEPQLVGIPSALPSGLALSVSLRMIVLRGE